MSTRVPPTRCLQKCFKRLCPDDRPIIGSNPYHRSCGPLAAILPLFSRRLQFPFPLLMPSCTICHYSSGDRSTRGFLPMLPPVLEALILPK